MLGIVSWTWAVWDKVGFGENGKVARKLLFICISGSYSDGIEVQDIVIVVFSQPSLSRGKACVSLNRRKFHVSSRRSFTRSRDVMDKVRYLSMLDACIEHMESYISRLSRELTQLACKLNTTPVEWLLLY